MKIALVHDDFIQEGGAESLFGTIAQIWPEAPIYTSIVDWNKLPKSIDKNRMRPSLLQKIPFPENFYRFLLPFYPLAFENFNFNDFDIVISSTTRFASGIITKPSTINICYINSVPRFLWDEQAKKEYLPKFFRTFFSPIFNWLQKWDKIASQRPDFYIANSQNVARKVKKHYGIASQVIYPAVDTDFFKPLPGKPKKDYYLVVTRLAKWKKVEIAIKAAIDLGIDLKIVGSGPDATRLMNLDNSVILNPSNSLRVNSVKNLNKIKDSSVASLPQNDREGEVDFLGSVSKEKLRALYQNAKALIVTQEEDFGIAMAEAQACGKLVIAYDRGGQKEIIVEGKTGLFFTEQTTDSLKDAIKRASKVKWESTACRNNALRFSQAEFVRKLKLHLAKYAKLS